MWQFQFSSILDIMVLFGSHQEQSSVTLIVWGQGQSLLKFRWEQKLSQ